MSNSCDDAAVRHGPWVEMAKYCRPLLRGSAPIDWSCGASDVAPTYFRSELRSSEKLTHADVTVSEHDGAAPLVACSSKPAMVERTAVLPEPLLTPCPLSGRRVDCTAPSGIWIDDACVITDAGRGEAYAGTRRFGTPVPLNSTRPLVSARYSRGRPPWDRSTVGSMVLVSCDGL